MGEGSGDIAPDRMTVVVAVTLGLTRIGVRPVASVPSVAADQKACHRPEVVTFRHGPSFAFPSNGYRHERRTRPSGTVSVADR